MSPVMPISLFIGITISPVLIAELYYTKVLVTTHQGPIIQ